MTERSLVSLLTTVTQTPFVSTTIPAKHPQKPQETPLMIGRYKLSTAATSILSGALLAAVLSFAAPRLHAEDIDRCQRHIAHEEHELHEAIEHHGRNSRQANRERRELHAARERCWREQHRWWDEHEHRWHTEHDWDEHDHDRD